MSANTLKSTAITNIDLSPPVRATAAQGGPAKIQELDGYVTVGGSDSSASIYKLLRVPSNVVVKRLWREDHGTITTLTADIGLYYSDESYDQTGISSALGGTVLDVDFFASAVAKGTVDTKVDVTNESGTYDVTKRGQPLWQAAGLSTDPGGNFDIAMTLTADASITGTVQTMLQVEFAQPYV